MIFRYLHFILIDQNALSIEVLYKMLFRSFLKYSGEHDH